MKQIQLVLAGGGIILAIYAGSLLFTDNVTIHDLNNVSIKNEKGEYISNAGSADDVAANYPHIREEVLEAKEAYVEEKRIEDEKKKQDEEDLKLTGLEPVNDEL